MNNIDIIFTHPQFLFLIIPSLAITLIPFFVISCTSRFTFRRTAAAVIRSIALTLLCFVIAGMSIVSRSDMYSVVILVDLSDSTKDLQADMISYAAELADSVSSNGTEVKTVAFASNSFVSSDLSLVGEKNGNGGNSDTLITDASDISSAIEYAASLMPDDRGKRIILLTDGLQTDNDAAESARYLASQGIRLDAVYFDSSANIGKEIQLTSLSASDGVYYGEDIHFIAQIDSSYPAVSTMILRENGKYSGTFSCDLEEGSNLFEFDIAPTEGGNRVFTLTLFGGEDRSPINNTASVSVNVKGKPSVLLIADSFSDASNLRQLLRDDYSVTLLTPRNAPKTFSELCQYDEVVLVNVDAANFPDGYDKILDTYVSKYGRTLLTIGGTSTYSFGNMKGNGYEELLPVDLEYEKPDEESSVALMLVIDRSRSMVLNQMNLPLAKEGAIMCTDSLNSTDYVGVISFCSTATLTSELLPATDANKDIIKRRISELEAGSGTSYSPPLALAYEELSKSDATARHVIFLSDGEPFDSGYYDIVSKMYSEGITVSTIGLSYNSYILEEMSALGGGSFYYVSYAVDLPDIMLSDAKLVTVNPFIRETTKPVINKLHPISSGFVDETIPVLNGYIGSKLKDGATAYLTSTDGDPIFACINRGDGIVASFMSDTYGFCSGEWYYTDDGKEITKRLVSTTLSKIPTSSSLNLLFSDIGNQTQITVETPGNEYSGEVVCQITCDSKLTELSLTNIAAGIYSGFIDTSNVGVYNLKITLFDDGSEIDFISHDLIVDYKKEYNLFSSDGLTLMSRLTSYGTGQLFLPNDDINVVSSLLPKTFDYSRDLLIPLGIIIGLLVLIDIGLRKLSLRDIKQFFNIR